MGEAPAHDLTAPSRALVAAPIAAIEREVDELRARAMAIVDELARRVGVVRATVEKLGSPPVIAGAAAALAIGVWWSARRRPQRDTVGRRVLTAALVTATTVLVRSLVQRMLRSL